MLNSSVLVLNRSYLPIHVTSARRAFSLVYQDVAHVVGEQYQTFDFEAWRRLPTDPGEGVGVSDGAIRVPRVIVLVRFDRIPRRHLRYSRLNIFVRDKYTCQYCGIRPNRSHLNIDHVVPRSLGGKTSWENVVCSCVDCNRRKGGRTPEQARLRLRRRPARPRWTPLANLAGSNLRYEQWGPFLRVVSGRQRYAEPGDAAC